MFETQQVTNYWLFIFKEEQKLNISLISEDILGLLVLGTSWKPLEQSESILSFRKAQE